MSEWATVESSASSATKCSRSPATLQGRVAVCPWGRAHEKNLLRGQIPGDGTPPSRAREPRAATCLLVCAVLALLAGCATRPQAAQTPQRRFDFAKDTFTYANGLVWEYRYDQDGKWTTRRREPKPDYSQHCFVVSRSAGQFFQNAIFDPAQSKADEATYRRLVKRLVSTSLRSPLPESERITFPGYANLRSFSQEHEALLKSECGGVWRCYFQRGNWRVIFPFSRHEQERMAQVLQDELRRKGIVVAHLVRFPQLSINHAVLLYEAKTSPGQVLFNTYDPNEPEKPTVVTFDRATRTFSLPPNAYFQGGRVDVYPIYDRLLY